MPESVRIGTADRSVMQHYNNMPTHQPFVVSMTETAELWLVLWVLIP